MIIASDFLNQNKKDHQYDTAYFSKNSDVLHWDQDHGSQTSSPPVINQAEASFSNNNQPKTNNLVMAASQSGNTRIHNKYLDKLAPFNN